MSRAPLTPRAMISRRSILKTTSRCRVEVELYRWTTASRAPRMEAKVLRMSCSLAWVSTCMSTPSGMWPPSMSSRRKSNSTCEAEGKPTSISLKPTSTSSRNISSFSSRFIGWMRAWLPSRRSTLHHTGARSMTRSGQVRSFRRTGGYGRYFFSFSLFITSLRQKGQKKGPRFAETVALEDRMVRCPSGHDSLPCHRFPVQSAERKKEEGECGVHVRIRW